MLIHMYIFCFHAEAVVVAIAAQMHVQVGSRDACGGARPQNAPSVPVCEGVGDVPCCRTSR